MSQKKFSTALLALAAFLMPAASRAQSIIDSNDSKYTTGDYSLNDMVRVAIGASQWVLGIIGSLALLMFIYGGFVFLISSGSSDKIGQAKKIIIAAVIGLIIVFASYLIIKYVLSIMGINWDGTDAAPTLSLLPFNLL